MILYLFAESDFVLLVFKYFLEYFYFFIFLFLLFLVMKCDFCIQHPLCPVERLISITVTVLLYLICSCWISVIGVT